MNKKEQHPIVFRPGLISLWDVNVYLAQRLVGISSDLAIIHFHTFGVLGSDDFEKVRPEIVGRLSNIAKEAESITLPMTVKFSKRLAGEAENSRREILGARVMELHERFEDEIKSIQFIQVQSDRLKYFNKTELAGPEFKTNFPRKGNVELIEAGNCFALDRYTGCVFHLMRCLEVVLLCLQSKLSIPLPKAEPDRTWGRTLERIRKKIEEYDKTPPANWPEWPQDKDFYKQGYALLHAIKGPYRDDTMHVESTYDEQSALDVFQVATVALRHFSTKLAE